MHAPVLGVDVFGPGSRLFDAIGDCRWSHYSLWLRLEYSNGLEYSRTQLDQILTCCSLHFQLFALRVSEA